MILRHHQLIFILIVLIVRLSRMQPAEEDEYEYDEYDAKAEPNYDAKQDSAPKYVEPKNLKQPSSSENAGNRNTLDSRNAGGGGGDQNLDQDLDYRTEKAENEPVDKADEEKLEEDSRSFKDVYFKNDQHTLSDKYDAINQYSPLKYDQNKNYERVPNNFELIDDYDTRDDQSSGGRREDEARDVNDALDEKHRLKHLDADGGGKSEEDEPVRERPRTTPNNRPNSRPNNRASNRPNSQPSEPAKEPPTEPKEAAFRPKPMKPKFKKNQVKLIKEIKYPKSLVSRPRYYYPGRNFVHQRQSPTATTTKKDHRKLSKIKVKSSKYVNDDLATLIPLELYKHQVKSRFVSSGEFSPHNGQSSRLLEAPQILNGELFCDCGFFLRVKDKKINKLSSKLKKVSKEQKQMKRKLVEMAVKENQLQLICRSQSKANLKYINKIDGRPGYLALSNSSAISNPIDLV